MCVIPSALLQTVLIAVWGCCNATVRLKTGCDDRSVPTLLSESWSVWSVCLPLLDVCLKVFPNPVTGTIDLGRLATNGTGKICRDIFLLFCSNQKI